MKPKEKQLTTASTMIQAFVLEYINSHDMPVIHFARLVRVTGKDTISNLLKSGTSVKTIEKILVTFNMEWRDLIEWYEKHEAQKKEP
ncbi:MULTISPECIES: hypothetical protein [Erysipelothrix]|uniref:hypothetical protein n=1 Tax=Erysipelothrix TaxID=1647 RepID=UPI00140B449C|nr:MULTISPECIES: hypothetical protein [Erysipelothrix]MDV7678437.1 hypothetical protein [Erysipelothrix rhusiopathiae]WMT70137.1 hypothetical protein K0H77_01105 [Erysipelothrix rhusiopathiae]